jgi:hypothetical protein
MKSPQRRPKAGKVKKVKAWAVVMCDGLLPDIKVGHIGDLYHIHSNKEEAEKFVEAIDGEYGDDWFAVPAPSNISSPHQTL